MPDILFKEESYLIIGFCMEVHSELGNGFLESVYQEALEREFVSNKIPHEREKELLILYKGNYLNKKYLADFICFNKIIVELKATQNIIPEHEAQLFNYLKATKFQLGILVNFGQKSLQYKRIVL